MTFKRVDPSQSHRCADSQGTGRNLAGKAEGELRGIELRLALKVGKGKDGVLKATLASPDQGANDIPISSIGLKDNVLTFESKVIGAKFTRQEESRKGLHSRASSTRAASSCR